VHVGFYETPVQLFQIARSTGLDLEDHVRSGLIELVWHPPREQIIDKIALNLLHIVRRTGAKRLFVDGVGGFSSSATHPERMAGFFNALANELRAAGVTTLWTEETHEPQGPDIHVSVGNVSAISENIVLLRCIDTPRGLHRLVSLKKVRGSGFDSSIHEMWVTTKGVRVSATAESATALLEGRGPMRTNVPGHAAEPPMGGGAMT
jgi:circadian clock protein KaiC